jgi:all-trans-retinol dehydrogenase (NAD+)
MTLLPRFARLGATVVTWDINQAGNEETVEMVRREGLRAVAYTVDMSDKEAIYQAARQTQEEVPPLPPP